MKNCYTLTGTLRVFSCEVVRVDGGPKSRLFLALTRGLMRRQTWTIVREPSDSSRRVLFGLTNTVGQWYHSWRFMGLPSAPCSFRYSQCIPQPVRNRFRQPPSNRDWLVTLPFLKIDIAAIDERRRPSTASLFLIPYEQVDCDGPLRVLLDVLTILLGRSVLALPFELRGTDEVILVLELRAVPRFVKRRQQKEVPWALHEPGVPDRR